MLDTGQVIADRYELLKQLGRGGFSEVWLALDKLTDVKVAIKIYAPGMGLDDAGISLFTQEFSLVFDINHTNLLHPTYYDCWERMPYLILPFCKNGSIFKYLTDNNRITETESWHLLHDVAEGLAYLHAKLPPVIHQDIKPDNILINDENGYTITDFGISTRIRSTLRRNQGQELSGGTLAYMGPERFGPSPAPIMASDIWSLGATMYELLTGLPPYGDHGGLLQKNGADIPLINNEEYSQELKEIVYKCLALNTWDRPTARQIADYAFQHINGNSVPLNIQSSQQTTSDLSSKDEINEIQTPEGQENSSFELKDNHESSSIHSDAEFPVMQSSDIKKRVATLFKREHRKLIIIAAIIIICATIVTIYLVTSGKEPEPEPEPKQKTTLKTNINDSICMTIIQEGNNYKSQGNIFRDKIDTLRQNNDSVFEDFYINAIKKYREVNHYKDSISKGVYMNAKDQIKQVEIILDSAYNLFILKADTMRMKEYDQIEAAEVFENRAKKIEPYINIDNNNNEEMH